jgi:hypothetical protein
MLCGIRAAGAAGLENEMRRQELDRRRRVESLAPGGRAPSPQPLTPIRPIGPGPPQKAGVSLFVDGERHA